MTFAISPRRYPALVKLLTGLAEFRANRVGQLRRILSGIAIVGFALYCCVVLVGAVMVYRLDVAQTKPATRLIRQLYPYPAAIVGPHRTASHWLRFFSYRVITMADVEREAGARIFFEEQTVGSSDAGKARRAALDRSIEAVLVVREANRLGVRVNRSLAESEFEKLAAPHGGRVAFREQVLRKHYNVTESFFIDRWIPEKLYRSGLVSVTARHILVALPNPASEKQEAEGKKKIEGIKSQIDKGLSFSDAAKQFSEDQSTKDQGGSVGTFSNGDVASPAFEDAALVAKTGEVTGPVRSEFGWHLIVVEERTGPLTGAFTPWLNGIKQSSKVWILDRRLR